MRPLPLSAPCACLPIRLMCHTLMPVAIAVLPPSPLPCRQAPPAVAALSERGASAAGALAGGLPPAVPVWLGGSGRPQSIRPPAAPAGCGAARGGAPPSHPPAARRLRAHRSAQLLQVGGGRGAAGRGRRQLGSGPWRAGRHAAQAACCKFGIPAALLFRPAHPLPWSPSWLPVPPTSHLPTLLWLLLCCRVQFDRQEMGVELVRDTDVMPAEPAENLPPALLGRSLMVLNGRQVINGQPVRPLGPRLPPAAAAAQAAAAAATGGSSASPLSLLGAGVKQEAAMTAAAGGAAQQQQQQQQPQQAARAADAKALAEVGIPGGSEDLAWHCVCWSFAAVSWLTSPVCLWFDCSMLSSPLLFAHSPSPPFLDRFSLAAGGGFGQEGSPAAAPAQHE